MKAMTFTQTGPPEVFEATELPRPVAGPGQVVIRVAAAGVNRSDVMERGGGFYPAKEQTLVGLECSGTIDDVGEGVGSWRVGDRVCALLNQGGYAEFVVAEAAQLLPVPPGVSLIEAAGIVEVAATVLSNFRIGGLRAGSTLLVHGGAGGIGTMAIQLGRALDATVITTAGTDEKVVRCLELGANAAINYRTEDFVRRVLDETQDRGSDMVLDNMGASHLARNIEALAIGGHIVIIGFQGGTEVQLDLWRLWQRRGAVHTTALRTRPLAEKAAIIADVRSVVWPLLEQRRVVPVIDSVLPLCRAADAHRLMEASGHVGKILLVPREAGSGRQAGL
jgi:putative PIG3 family NAD(P)H quinone oxidoreductase